MFIVGMLEIIKENKNEMFISISNSKHLMIDTQSITSSENPIAVYVLQEYVKHIPIYIIHIILDAVKISASILYTIHMFTTNNCSSTIRDVYKSILIIFLLYVSVSFYYNIKKLYVVSTWNTTKIMEFYKHEHIIKRIKIFNICLIVSMILYSVIVYNYLCSDITHWLVIICIYVFIKIITTTLLYTKLKLSVNYLPDIKFTDMEQ